MRKTKSADSYSINKITVFLRSPFAGSCPLTLILSIFYIYFRHPKGAAFFNYLAFSKQ